MQNTGNPDKNKNKNKILKGLHQLSQLHDKPLQILVAENLKIIYYFSQFYGLAGLSPSVTYAAAVNWQLHCVWRV